MELDFEDLISQSIITNNDNSKSVSVQTTQSKEYDLIYNKKDSSFAIKVKNDGFICDECGEIYEIEQELNIHKRQQKCRRKYKTKAELKELPMEYSVNRFLQIDLSTYHEIIDDNDEHLEKDVQSDEYNDSLNTDDAVEHSDDDDEDDDDDSKMYPYKKKFRCPECRRVCGSKIGYTMHIRSHKSKRGRKT